MIYGLKPKIYEYKNRGKVVEAMIYSKITSSRHD